MMDMVKENEFITALGNVDIDIEGEICEAIKGMYLAIARVDLDTNEAVVLHGDSDEAIGNTYPWDAYLAYYTDEYIQLPDRRRVLSNFGSTHLRQCWQDNNRLFSYNYTSQVIKKNKFHVTVLTFMTAKNGHRYAYVLVRNAGGDNILLSIVQQYVYDTCDYFIYLDAKNNSYTMFSGLANTPLPPVQCLDYETAVVEYAREFVAPEDQDRVIASMHLAKVEAELKQHAVYSFTCGIVDEHGSYTRKRLDYRYHDKENHMILLSRIDITNVYMEEKRNQRNLEVALLRAQSDPLTKLWNFQATMDKINECLKETQQEYALLFIDLDNFKRINDTFGHPAGDKVLRSIASVLVKEAEVEDIVGRVGGDEFVFFAALQNGDTQEVREKALMIADRIRQVPIDEKGCSTVSGSIGIAIAPRDGQEYYTLVTKADMGLYKVKANGKNGYSF